MDAVQFAELLDVIKHCSGLILGALFSLILAVTWKG